MVSASSDFIFIFLLVDIKLNSIILFVLEINFYHHIYIQK